MSPTTQPHASPAPPRAEDLVGLREDLGAHFTLQAVEDLLGPGPAAALHREQRVPALMAARDAPWPKHATATLTRLFLLGDTLTRAELDAALPATRTAGAEHIGLVAAAGNGGEDEVQALIDLRPYEARDAAGLGQWWLAADLAELATGQGLASDHVLGVGSASTTLAGLTIRTPRRTALDLGTGCGVQALHATRHCQQVVGTDVSSRALAFAHFNAALAGTTLDLRQGSMLQPVAGEEYDLIVSNPPFVLTPPAAYAAGLPVMSYRDGAQRGDSLIAELVTSLGAHLRADGVAQLLGNWEHHEGEGWQERLHSWLVASGLDGWIIQREVQDGAEYVETWLRDGGIQPGSPSYEAVYEAWLRDFTARGVTGVGFGYLVLHRPAAARDVRHRVEETTGPSSGPLGEHIANVLATEDWLAARDDDELAREYLLTAGDVTEERYLRPGASDPEVVLLRQGGGLGRVIAPGTLLAGAVGACDGELSLAQIITGLATLFQLPAAEVAGDVLPGARRLLRDGLLHPAGHRGQETAGSAGTG